MRQLLIEADCGDAYCGKCRGKVKPHRMKAPACKYFGYKELPFKEIPKDQKLQEAALSPAERLEIMQGGSCYLRLDECKDAEAAFMDLDGMAGAATDVMLESLAKFAAMSVKEFHAFQARVRSEAKAQGFDDVRDVFRELE